MHPMGGFRDTCDGCDGFPLFFSLYTGASILARKGSTLEIIRHIRHILHILLWVATLHPVWQVE